MQVGTISGEGKKMRGKSRIAKGSNGRIQKGQKHILGVTLSPENFSFLSTIHGQTNRPFANLVNLAIDNARLTNAFKGIGPFEPKMIQNMRQKLQDWETKVNPKLIAHSKTGKGKRGRPKKNIALAH